MALLLHVCCRSLLKTLLEKEKLLVTSNFSFTHSVFYPFWEFSIFTKFRIVVYKLFQLEESTIFCLGKGLEHLLLVENSKVIHL